MGGYLNRVIQLDFPELAGSDEVGRPIIWLTVRNPKLLTGNELVGNRGTVRRDPDGTVHVDQEEGAKSTYAGFAKLIIAGNVLDPTVDSETPPAFTMPPSSDDVGKFPIVILNRLGELVASANPH